MPAKNYAAMKAYRDEQRHRMNAMCREIQKSLGGRIRHRFPPGQEAVHEARVMAHRERVEWEMKEEMP